MAARRAQRLFGLRRRIWRINLTLVGILLVSHISLKFVLPGFPAAEYLATELGILEAGTFFLTRRIIRAEESLKREFSSEIEPDS